MRRNLSGSSFEVTLVEFTSRITLDSTLSSQFVELKPPQMWEQYSIQWRINPLYSWSNCSEEKNLQHLNRTPNFSEADLAICVICGFQDKFEVIVIPRNFIASHGVIVELSKEIGELRGVLERDAKKRSFWSIKLNMITFAPLGDLVQIRILRGGCDETM